MDSPAVNNLWLLLLAGQPGDLWHGAVGGDGGVAGGGEVDRSRHRGSDGDAAARRVWLCLCLPALLLAL